MADPFSQTPAPPADPNSTGFLGMSPSFWQNLANFGANMSVAANARGPEGWLTYGNGFAGPAGAAMLETEKQARQQNESMASQQLTQAQAWETRTHAKMNELQIPLLQAQVNMLKQMSSGQGDGGMAPGAADSTPGAPGSNGTDITGNIIGTMETGNDPDAYSKVNAKHYSGRYQFGTAEMAASGMYSAAQGENLQDNSWGGTINVPGYQPASYAQFMASKPMQDAAFQIATAYNWQELKKSGADQYIGQTVGGVPITQASLLAGAWQGGAMGVTRFIKSGGQYNPTDGNIPLSQFMTNAEKLAEQYGLPNSGVAGAQAQNGQSYDPNLQLNPNDQLGPLAAPGMPTPGKASQLANQYYALATKYGALGWTGAASAAQARADYYAKIAAAGVQPMDLRPGGGGVNSRGQIYKMGTPYPGYGAGNTAQMGFETSPFSVNGQAQSPGTWEPVVQGGQQPPGAPPPGGPPPASDLAPGGSPAIPAPTPGPQASAAPAASGDMPLPATVRTLTGGPVTAFDTALLGQPMPAAPPSNQPLLAEPNPLVKTNTEELGKDLAEEVQAKNEAAQSAEMNNAQLDSLNADLAGKTTDAFTPMYLRFKQIAVATGHLLRFSDTDMPQWVSDTGDLEAAKKNTMSMLMTQAHQTNSRMAVQEVGMQADAIPNMTMLKAARKLVTGQMQGINDFAIGQSQALSTWHAAMMKADTGTQQDELNKGFDPQFYKRITPMAFIVHRWLQDPDTAPAAQKYIKYMKAQYDTFVKTGGRQGSDVYPNFRAQMAYGDSTGLFQSVQARGGGQ